MADMFHTFFGISGLSLLGHFKDKKSSNSDISDNGSSNVGGNNKINDTLNKNSNLENYEDDKNNSLWS